MENSYPRIASFAPSLQKKSQHFFQYRDKMFLYLWSNSTIQFDVFMQFLSIFLIIECH